MREKNRQRKFYSNEINAIYLGVLEKKIAKYSKSYYSSSKFNNQENSDSTSNNDVVGWKYLVNNDIKIIWLIH